jgi:hypothetical protein
MKENQQPGYGLAMNTPRKKLKHYVTLWYITNCQIPYTYKALVGLAAYQLLINYL